MLTPFVNPLVNLGQKRPDGSSSATFPQNIEKIPFNSFIEVDPNNMIDSFKEASSRRRKEKIKNNPDLMNNMHKAKARQISEGQT